MKFLFYTCISIILLFPGTAFISSKNIQPVITLQKFNENRENFTGKNINNKDIRILNRWDMPRVLKEISGIAYIDDDRFACVQDELGTVFIYNCKAEKIEKEIPFAGPGDFEGITLVGNDAYVIRADGRLFSISDITGEKNLVNEYTTPLTAGHDVEGLCYDVKNERLMLAFKDSEPGKPDYKGIYSFDLASKKLDDKPIIKIDLRHAVFLRGQKKKAQAIMPSAMGIHPLTNDIYITEGHKAQLLVLDKEGNIKNLFELDTRDFSQPEGITFNPQGKLFISNEGVKEPGNILEVVINN